MRGWLGERVAGPDRKRNAKARAIAAARPDMRAFEGFDAIEAWEALRARFAGAVDEERERGRFFLWLPVAAICGVLLFFAAERDPALWAAVAAFAAAAVLAYAARAGSIGFPAAMLVLALAAGFLSAAVRVERAASPILEKPVRGAAVGVVKSVEPRARGVRLVLELESLGGLDAGKLPARARVTVPRLEGAEAGARISVEAVWRPPPGPTRPGGYDFAREAFFLGIGAVGGEARVPVVLSLPVLTFMSDAGARIDRLRNALTARIVSAVDGDPGAIAAALVTGQRGEISKEANDALRVAGLYHVISISGLHMALFGGTLFGVLRFGLALIPGFGLRHPIKKWSAVAALIGAGFYLVLSGAEVAVQRSFVMIAIVFLAVLFDRQGVTMRNLALAAFAAILLMPEAVLGPSFQMSFCAVMAIVAWYERVNRRAPDEVQAARTGGVMRFAQIYFGGVTATTIAATLATAPFSTFHFQRFAVHSLPSNLIALPIVGLLVMPWALVGIVLMPFGLDGFAWRVMGFGIELMLLVSEWIASWPVATLAVPAFPALAACLLAFGLIWLALWTTRLRLLGLVPAVAGILVASFPDRPDIYVEPGGRAAAVRGADGKLQLVGTRFASFAAGTWLAADGDMRGVRDKSTVEHVRCDSFGCTAPLADGRVVALSWTYAGLSEDCTRAAIVITRLIAPPACRQTAYVIDAADLARSGAVTLTRIEDGSFAEKAARGDAERIWQGKIVEPEGPVFALPVAKAEEANADPIDAEEGEDEDQL
jgi:competence protein ComEC